MLSGETETYSTDKCYVKKDRSQIWVSLNVSLVREPGSINLSVGTVKINVKRIINKPGVSSRTRAAVYAAENGLTPREARAHLAKPPEKHY